MWYANEPNININEWLVTYPKALKARSSVEEMHELRGQRTDDLLDDKQLIDVTVAWQQRLAVTQLSQNASHRPDVYRLAVRRSASCHTIKVKRFYALNFNSFPSLFCVSCASLNRKLSLFDTFFCHWCYCSYPRSSSGDLYQRVAT